MRHYESAIISIEQHAHENHLKTGDKLPSIRFWSESLGFNKATIIKAYETLISQHSVYVIPKSGYYWLKKETLASSEACTIDFTRLHPDSDILPYKAFEHCLNQAIRTYQRELFTYGSVEGLPALRSTLQKHLASRQVHCSAKHIVISSGSQQALAILTEMPMHSSTTLKKGILVEQPSYILFQQIAKTRGIPIAGFSRTTGGIDFKQLEKHLKTGAFKCIYTIPRAHNPLGTSLCDKDKQRLTALAQAYDAYIIEDDYLGDLMPNTESLPIHYYDTNHRVIYVKSFSKAFLPGIRLGAVVLPPELFETFCHYKRIQDLNTAILSQGALDLFIASGLYDQHTHKARLHYQTKRLQIEPLLKQLELEGVRVEPLQTGFLTYLTFEHNFPMSTFLKKAALLGLKLTPSDDFYLEPHTSNPGLRLCFAPLSIEDIKQGIALLTETLKSFRY